MFGAPVKKSVVAHIRISSCMIGAPMKKSVVAHIRISSCMFGAPVKKSVILLCDNTCKCQHSSFKNLPFA